MTRALVIVLAVAAPAAAGPFKETLKRDEIVAIEKAIQDALPKPDPAIVKKCQVELDAYNKAPDAADALDHVTAAATCFRSAGSLGAAIQMWNIVAKYASSTKMAVQKRDATHELAIAYEAAAMFDDAAKFDEQFVKTYGKDDDDTRERLAHAICIRRQLGDEREATSDAAYWTHIFRRVKLDANTLCDSLRPIAMPAKH
jgi:hypothetical protein